MAIIGIDLGTTNSLVSVWKDGKSVLIPNSLGGFLTPSVVSVDEDGSILVGNVAKERLISHPERSAASFKRLMGTSRKQNLGGQQFSPEELSSFVLRRLKEDAQAYLGEPVTEAVISVPAYFNDNQRFATKAAARLAGLHAERLINEPSAAALASRLNNTEKDQSFLVFDFGGCTLDVSVVDCFDNVIEISAVAGDNHLGGNDFDQAIARYFCQENGLAFDLLPPVRQAALLKQAELCKQALTEQPQVLLFQEEQEQKHSLLLTRELLVRIAAPLFQRMNKVIARALSDSGRSIREIDEVLLVGGSCRMPVVRAYLSHILGIEPAELGSPDTIVAQGVGVYAGIKAQDGEIRDIMMTDVCPFTLGIASYNDEKDTRPHMSPMIERNSVLPTSVEHSFYTLSDNQKAITVRVYQGEAYYTEANLKLGELEVEVPPAPRGQESVQVRFSYDINGILEVDVHNKTNGVHKSKVILGENTRLSEKELQKRLSELQKLKIHPMDREENRLVVARGERLFSEAGSELRERVGAYLAYFQRALDSQSPSLIHHAREQANRFFDSVERYLFDHQVFPGRDYEPFDEDEED